MSLRKHNISGGAHLWCLLSVLVHKPTMQVLFGQPDTQLVQRTRALLYLFKLISGR